MTTLRHPHIHPPLEIHVDDELVESHLRAGWLPADEVASEEAPEKQGKPARRTNPSTDSEPTGEDHEQENA